MPFILRGRYANGHEFAEHVADAMAGDSFYFCVLQEFVAELYKLDEGDASQQFAEDLHNIDARLVTVLNERVRILEVYRGDKKQLLEAAGKKLDGGTRLLT